MYALDTEPTGLPACDKFRKVVRLAFVVDILDCEDFNQVRPALSQNNDTFNGQDYAGTANVKHE